MMLKLILLGLLATSAFAARVPKKHRGDGTAANDIDDLDDLGTHGQGHGYDPANPDGDSSDDEDSHEEPLHAAEFQGAVQDIKTLLLNASDLSLSLSTMAADANADVQNGDYSQWDTIRHDFDLMAVQTANHFMEAEDKLWSLAEKLYTKPGDFGTSHTCSNLHTFVTDHSDEDGEFIFDAAITVPGALNAMQEDIQCFHGIYEEARQIPDDTAGWAMEDAFDLVADTYKRVFRLRTAGMRFHQATENIGRAEAKFAAENAIDEVHVQERVLLKRLLTLITKNL